MAGLVARPDPRSVEVIAPGLLEVHDLYSVPAVREVPPDQAHEPVRAEERHRQVAGLGIAEPDRVVALGPLRLCLGRTASPDLQVLFEAVATALVEEPDLRHKR